MFFAIIFNDLLFYAKLIKFFQFSDISFHFFRIFAKKVTDMENIIPKVKGER